PRLPQALAAPIHEPPDGDGLVQRRDHQRHLGLEAIVLRREELDAIGRSPEATWRGRLGCPHQFRLAQSGDVTPGGAIPLPHLTSGPPVARAFSRVMTTTRSRPIQPEYQLKFTSNVPNMALVSQGSFDFHLYAPGPSSRAKNTISW